MQIDRVLYPITSLGPGNRLVIWTIGCSLGCYNCSNPELWSINPNKDISVDDLINAITQATEGIQVDGITITGGNPIEQSKELAQLLPLLSEITDDILLFTGYKYEELNKYLSETEHDVINKYVSVLIDGTYIDELNDNICPLQGSSNQNIIFINENKKPLYSDYLKKGRTIQNVFYNNSMISVGIHNKEL